jgi:hypothetical protein
MRGQLGTAHFSVVVLLYWVGMRYKDMCVYICVYGISKVNTISQLKA